MRHALDSFRKDLNADLLTGSISCDNPEWMSRLCSYPYEEVPMSHHPSGGTGGLPSVESPYGVPQDAVGDSGGTPPGAAALLVIQQTKLPHFH